MGIGVRFVADFFNNFLRSVWPLISYGYEVGNLL